MIKITLSVGDHSFITSLNTVESCGGFLSALVEHRKPDETCFYIDRDGTHFRHVLNFARNSPSFPDSVHELHELRNEADFYSLDKLIRLIDIEKPKIQRRSIFYQLELIKERLSS